MHFVLLLLLSDKLQLLYVPSANVDSLRYLFNKLWDSYNRLTSLSVLEVSHDFFFPLPLFFPLPFSFLAFSYTICLECKGTTFIMYVIDGEKKKKKKRLPHTLVLCPPEVMVFHLDLIFNPLICLDEYTELAYIYFYSVPLYSRRCVF